MFKSRYLSLAVVAALSPLAILPQIAVAQVSDESIEEVLVVGQRGMLSSSINAQRNAAQIKSIVTNDSIGNMVDQNVAEAVRKLSGVNVLNDQGEGRFISVRGLDPTLNSASVNGVRIPSPEGDTRAVALDVIPSELVQSIEVIKTLTADMDADTIGAAIRINTVSAFDKENEFVKGQVVSSYNDLNGKYSPEYGIDFSQAITDRLGVAGGFKFSERKTSTDNMEMDGWSETDDGQLYAEDVEYRDYDVLRERTGLSLSFDLKASDTTNLYFRTLYSKFDDTEERRALVFGLDDTTLVSGSANSAVFNSGAYDPQNDNDPTNDGDDPSEFDVEREHKDRYESQTIQSYQFGGETQLNDWVLDYSVAFSTAEEEENNTTDPTLFAATFDPENLVEVAFDFSNMEFAPYTVNQGADIFFAPETYEVDKLELVDGKAEDEETAFAFNAERSFALSSGDTVTFKTGFKLRQREKTFDLSLQVLEDFDGDYTLADVLGRQSYGLFNIEPMMDLNAVRAFNAANLGLFSENEFDTDLEGVLEDFTVEEDITAVYAMGTYEADKLTLIGGIRVEQTETTALANTIEILEANDADIPDDTFIATPTNYEDDYTTVLPSASLKYDVQPDMLVRAGVFKSLVRPNIEQLAPRFIVEQNDEGERSGEFGNPDLEPYEAWNLDLSFEYYFAESAVAQAGYFYKDIDNFIVNREFASDEAPYNGVYNGVSFDEAVIPLNGENATVSGFELAYNQVFDNGFLVSLNYTYTDTEGDLGDRTVPLPASSEVTYNAILGYEKNGFSTRIAMTYRDNYLDEVNGSAEEDRYVQDHTQVDVSAAYDVTENVNVFVKIANLTDEPYVAYQSGPGRSRLLQYEEYSYTARFGIRARF